MSLATLPKIVGFFSYARLDDEDSAQRLSKLRDRIRGELRSQLGRHRTDFRLWQDTEAIAIGTLWESEIRKAIAESVFFIPIVTPSAVRSEYCKREFELFLERERRLRREDLVFPILYIDVPELEDASKWRGNDYLGMIAARQRADWRKLRSEDEDTKEFRQTIENYCKDISSALRRSPLPHPEVEATSVSFSVPSELPGPTKSKPPPGPRPWPSFKDIAKWLRDSRGTALAIGAVVVAFFGIWFVVTPATVTPTTPVTPITPKPPIQSAGSITPLPSERERALKPRERFRECDKCPDMVVMPSTSFIMGSPNEEKGSKVTEGPQRRVTFKYRFAVGRFSVTFDEWSACVANGPCGGYSPHDAGWGGGSLPVINVSWNEAKTYVAWLSRTTGKSYRLLSEAEREYVTRADRDTPFWFGKDISTKNANYNGNYAYDNGKTTGEFRQRTVLVETFDANPWGLFQVHGNVWEWVEDCWDNDYQDAPTDGSAHTWDACKDRVLRGGAWRDPPVWLRSASRWPGKPDSRGENDRGLRVARTLLP